MCAEETSFVTRLWGDVGREPVAVIKGDVQVRFGRMRELEESHLGDIQVYQHDRAEG